MSYDNPTGFEALRHLAQGLGLDVSQVEDGQITLLNDMAVSPVRVFLCVTYPTGYKQHEIVLAN